MQIFWYGQACFKILSQDLVLITDPYSRKIGLTPPRVKANFVTVSHNHLSHNNIETIRGNPIVFNGPGEYETKNLRCTGISTFHDKNEGRKLGPNVVYIIELEKIKICHLGDLGHLPSSQQIEKINGIDILMVPVGETNMISIKEAISLINELEPRIVIPMHYKLKGLKRKLSSLSKFCTEWGVKETKPEEKLVIKKKNLPQEEIETVILKNHG